MKRRIKITVTNEDAEVLDKAVVTIQDADTDQVVCRAALSTSDYFREQLYTLTIGRQGGSAYQKPGQDTLSIAIGTLTQKRCTSTATISGSVTTVGTKGCANGL